MSRIKALMLFIALVFSGALCAADSKPHKVIDGGNGLFYGDTVSMLLGYVVDTVAQSCYAQTRAGITTVPCANLKNREEWKAVITW